MPAADIIRNSAEPFYLQLGRWLEGQISAGSYVSGDRLPSESELCRQFSLSRSTVRECLRNLQERGKIRLVQRRGAFVCGPEQPSWMLQFAEGFSETEANFNKRDVDTKVLRVEHTSLPDEACTALGLTPKSVGVSIERLRRLDGKLALYCVNYLLSDLAPIIGDGSVLSGPASLNRVLRSAGWAVHGARRSLAAVAAPKRIARHLGVETGDPLMLIRSVSWNTDRKIFDYYSSWVRSEAVAVEIEVQVRHPADTHIIGET